VVVVEPKSMGPTIVHVQTIISDNGWRLGSTRRTGGDWWPRRWGWCGGRLWQCTDGSVGAMKPHLASSELTETFFVFACEMDAKFNEHFVGSQVDAPGVTGSGKHASCFKHGEGEVNDGNVHEGIITGSRDVLNFT